jgi:enoyl-CoA hydratase
VTVSMERHEGTIVAFLDDGKANALSFEMIAGLQSALATSIDENVPLVMAGREGNFSAGFELQIMRSGDRDRIAQLVDQGTLLFREMFAAPIPILAACTGHALAAGALLLLAADYRIGQCGPHKIGLNETQIGIALPQFAIDMARLRLSPNRLIAATLFASILSPEEACEVGYLDRIAEDAHKAARTLAQEVASMSSSVFAKTKRRLNAEIVRQLSEPHHSDGRP